MVALDYSDPAAALSLARRLDPTLCRLKVGKELFTVAGPKVVRQLQGLGYQIFLDLKFHDIPHTVAQACRAAADLGVWMLTVHATGGKTMLRAAREAVEAFAQPPLVAAVTVLTSLDSQDLTELGIRRAVPEQALALAELAGSVGIKAVVCSAQDLRALRPRLADDCAFVTPGIRPAETLCHDQKRVVTPNQAIRAGASYLVIGRPITQATDPYQTLLTIVSDLACSSSLE